MNKYTGLNPVCRSHVIHGVCVWSRGIPKEKTFFLLRGLDCQEPSNMELAYSAV